MGGASFETKESSLRDDKFIAKLNYYDQVHNEQLGVVKIYRTNEKPCQYIMMYSESQLNDQDNRQKLQDKLHCYQGLPRNCHIVAIEAIRLNKANEMCARTLSLDIFCRYYNYTLEMAILRKLSLNKRFKEADLFYILESLVEICLHLHSHLKNQYLDIFHLKNIYISPQGFLKMYPFPIDACIDKYFFGSKRKWHRRGQSQISVDVSPKKTSEVTVAGDTTKAAITEQANSFRDIGVIILQLILLDKHQTEINNFSIQKKIALLDDAHQDISQTFINIVTALLKEITAEELQAAIDGSKAEDRAVSTCIRLDQGPDIKASILEKNNSLRRLSQHRNLKAGMINICSKKQLK